MENKGFLAILAVTLLIIGGVFFLFSDTGTSSKDKKEVASVAEVSADDHVIKAVNEKIVIIEYGDFECPFCGTFYPLLKQAEVDFADNVSFVFRHFPLVSSHPNALAAHRAAEAAANQGKFFEMHDLIYENQDEWSSQATDTPAKIFEKYAKELELDLEKYQKDVASSTVFDRITKDQDSGKAADVNSTPTIFVDGEKIQTPTEYAAFKTIIEEAIKAADAKENE